MKIDRKQSIKNKVGVVLVSLALSSALIPSTASAENFNYTDEQTKVDFIYDDDHVGRGASDEGTYKLVIITNLENGDYSVVGFDQLDEILEKQNDEILVIDGKEFSMESVLTARNNLQEKIKQMEDEEAQRINEGILIAVAFGAIPFAVMAGYASNLFIYNIRRGFQEDKSRRQFTKHIKTK